jgi:hypothetical protein
MDIPFISQQVLDKAKLALGKPVKGFTQEAMDCLTAYRWPGNVRELQNEIQPHAGAVCDARETSALRPGRREGQAVNHALAAVRRLRRLQHVAAVRRHAAFPGAMLKSGRHRLLWHPSAVAGSGSEALTSWPPAPRAASGSTCCASKARCCAARTAPAASTCCPAPAGR